MGLACAGVKCSGIDAKSAGPGWVEERELFDSSWMIEIEFSMQD
jgi:hypothetical protein